MFYSYKNCQVNLSGVQILASNVSIDVQSSTEAKYVTNRRFSYDYVPTDSVTSVINISYYLTGIDPIKAFIHEEKTALDGSIGGLLFTSGYISSYSINAAANQPVAADIQIVVFDHITGTFSANTSAPQNTPVLNCSNVTLDEVNIGNSGNIASAAYSFRTEIKPHYHVQTGEGLTNLVPERVTFGRKQISTKVDFDGLSGQLSLYGDQASLKLHLRDASDGLVKETYIASGIIDSRNISVSEDSFTRGTLIVKQEAPGEAPSITGYHPSTGEPGHEITVSGYGFNVFPEVFLGSVYISEVEYLSDKKLTFIVPLGGVTGPISLRVGGNKTSTPTSFGFISNGVEVDGISPTSGLLGTRIKVSGSNFNTADEIYIGETLLSEFIFINDTLAEAVIPNAAQWGYVTVKSNFTNTSGTSASKFLPFPVIKSLDLLTASAGDNIIITGLALSGTTAVSFNGISATIGTITDPRHIPVTLPAGNTSGPVILTTQLGAASYFTGFITYAEITSSTPDSGPPGQSVTIGGNDFYSSNLKRAASGISSPLYDNFIVDFNGVTGAFGIQSSAALTGYVPVGASSGVLSLLTPDGGAHASTQIFNATRSAPIVSSAHPSTGLPAVRGRQGQIIEVSGSDLVGVTGLYLVSSVGASTSNLLFPATVYSSELSETSFQFSIPSGVSGISSVRIQTSAGSGIGSNILFIKSVPTLSSFSPSTASRNAYISVSGDGFYSDTTKLYFSGIMTSGVLVPSTINFITYSGLSGIIPGLSSSINYKVVVDNGVDYATSAESFGYIGAPSLSGFTPLSGATLSSVVLSGRNLKNITSIEHGFVPITGFSYLGDIGTGVLIEIPNTTGYLSRNALFRNNIAPFNVRSALGSSATTGDFETIPPAMVFSGFYPSSQIRGDIVKITGLNIFQTTGVGFSGVNGLVVTPFTNAYFAKYLPANGFPKTGIEVRVPTDAISGPITLIGTYDSEVSASNLSVNTNNSVSEILPSSGIYGDTIVIRGDDIHASRFYFNGIRSGTINNTTPFIESEDQTSINLNGTLGLGILSGLNTEYTISGVDKVANIIVPHPISRTTPIYSTNREYTNPSESDLIPSAVPFTPLPLISGISHTTISVGDTLYVSGLNAVNLNLSCLGISGNTTLGSGRIEFVSKYNTSNKEVNGEEQSFFGLGEFFIPPEPTSSYLTDPVEPFEYNYPIYKGIIGSGVTDSRTGLYVIPLQVGSNFIGTGKVFLFFDEPAIYPTYGAVRILGGDTFSGQNLPTNYETSGSAWNRAFTGSRTAARLSGLLFKSWDLIITPETIQVSGFSPASGYAQTSAHIIGSGLGSIENLHLVDDLNVYYQLTITSRYANDITFTVPNITPESGRISLGSPTASGISSQYFRILKPPTITGFSPSEGTEGSVITIFGKYLQDAATVRLNSKLNNEFYSVTNLGQDGVDSFGNVKLTGLVPTEISPLPQKFDIYVNSATAFVGGTSTGIYKMQIKDLDVFGNLTVYGHTRLNSGVHITGEVAISGDLRASGDSTFNDAYVTGTFNASGDSTLSNSNVTGTLGVSGNSTLNNTSVAGTLGVSELSTLDDVVIEGELTVAGGAELNTITADTATIIDLYATDEFRASGISTLNDVYIRGTFNTSGVSTLSNAHITGALKASGHSTFNTALFTGSSFIVSGDINITGITHNLYINGTPINSLSDVINISGSGIVNVYASGETNYVNLYGAGITDTIVSITGGTNTITSYSGLSVFATGDVTLNNYIYTGNTTVGSLSTNYLYSGTANITGGNTSITGGISNIYGDTTVNIDFGTNTLSGNTINTTFGTNSFPNFSGNFTANSGENNINGTGITVNFISGSNTLVSGQSSISGSANIYNSVNSISGTSNTFSITGGPNTIQQSTEATIFSGTNTISNSGGQAYVTGSATIFSGTNYVTGNTIVITGGVNSISGTSNTFSITGGTSAIYSSGATSTISNSIVQISGSASIANAGGYVYVTGGSTTIANAGGNTYLVSILTGSAQVTGVIEVTGRLQLSGEFQYNSTGSIPLNSASAGGTMGDFVVDSNYLYYKSSAGWRRLKWATF